MFASCMIDMYDMREITIMTCVVYEHVGIVACMVLVDMQSGDPECYCITN